MSNLRAFAAACGSAWAIQPEALQGLLEIAAREHQPDFAAVEAARARRTDSGLTMRDGVAIISVTGPIVRYADMFSAISGATSVSTLAREFNTALSDPSVRAILLNIDSPGGEVAGINEFAQMVFDARGKKPVLAYVDGMAASAAYWIASAADEIVTDNTGLLGSIGVVATVANPDVKSAREVQFVSSQSPNKRPNPNTDAGKSQLQTMVDDLADVFVSAVARNRGVTPDAVINEFGQGGVMVGAKAVDAGLADRLGSFEQIVSELAAGNWRKKGKTNMAAQTEAAEENTMTIQEIKAAFSEVLSTFRAKAEEAAAPIETASTDQLAQERAARERAEADALALRQRLVTQAAEAAQTAAETFADEQTAAGRMYPAERQALLAQYTQAAADDVASPLANGSRVATLRALIETRPANGLTQERVGETNTRTLRADENAQTELSAERRNALLAATPIGKAALKAVN